MSHRCNPKKRKKQKKKKKKKPSQGFNTRKILVPEIKRRPQDKDLRAALKSLEYLVPSRKKKKN